MKRLFALIMVLALCLSLCSCGNKGSGLTLDALEQTIKESDDDAELTVTEETDGSTFQYEGSVLFCTLTMTGTVDKKQNVTQFRVEARNLDIDHLNSLSVTQLVRDMNDSRNVIMKRLAVDILMVRMANIAALTAKDKDDDAMLEALDILLESRSGSRTYNGWVYRITSDSSADTMTLTAVFDGTNS